MFFTKVFLFMSFTFASLTFGQENKELDSDCSVDSNFFCQGNCQKSLYPLGVISCKCDDKNFICSPKTIKANSYVYTNSLSLNRSSFFEFSSTFHKVNAECYPLYDSFFSVDGKRMVTSQKRFIDRNFDVYTDILSNPMEDTSFKISGGDCDL
jgi:hypothetical protein